MPLPFVDMAVADKVQGNSLNTTVVQIMKYFILTGEELCLKKHSVNKNLNIQF